MESDEQKDTGLTSNKVQAFEIDRNSDDEINNDEDLDRNPEDRFRTYILQAKKNITMLNYVEGCSKSFLIEDESLEKCISVESYELDLKREIEEWKELYVRICDKRESKKGCSVISRDTLPESKRAYLEEAPDLRQLVRYTKEFRQEALNLIEIDFAELKTKMETLKEIFQRRGNMMKRNAILSCFATPPSIEEKDTNHGHKDQKRRFKSTAV